MKRLIVPSTLLGVLLALLIVPLLVSTPSISAPRDGKHELILMRCDMVQGAFKVTNYSASQSAPSKTLDNCAEALAFNHRNGFSIEAIGYFDAGDGYIVYTLAR